MTTDKVNRALIFDEQEDHNETQTTPNAPLSQNNIRKEAGIKFQINLGHGQLGIKRKRQQSNKKDQFSKPQQSKISKQTKVKSQNSQNLAYEEQNAYSFRDTSLPKPPNIQKSLQKQQKEIDSIIEKTQRQLQAASKSQAGSKYRSKSPFGVSSEKESSSSTQKLTGHIQIMHDAKRMTPGLFQQLDEEEINNNRSINPLQYQKKKKLEDIQESKGQSMGDSKASKIYPKKLPPLTDSKNVQMSVSNSLQRAQDSSMIVLEHMRQELSEPDANQNEINLKEMREMELAMTCPPPHRLWRCSFIIDRSCCSYPIFSLKRKDSSFLVNAKKQFCRIHSYYQITANEKTFGGSVRSNLGYLRSNFAGTEFNLYDQRKGICQLVCTICYKAELSCSATFRNIQIYIRSQQVSYSQLHGAGDKSYNLKDLYQYQQNVDNKKIIRLVNKKPEWNQKHKCYIMNLKGRGKIGSVKNMALIEEENPQKYIMLFCKADTDNFHLEIVRPLSPFIAIGILLSSFDFKLCCQ